MTMWARIAIAAAFCAAAVPANATLLQFEMTGFAEPYRITEYALFTIDTDRPVDDYYDGAGFEYAAVPGIYTFGNTTITMDDIYFYSDADLGGIWGETEILAMNGPQVYTGPESAPTFLTGTFQMYDAFWDNSPLTLTITDVTPAAVPEAATWAMMLGGFGLVGAAMRRRRVAAIA